MKPKWTFHGIPVYECEDLPDDKFYFISVKKTKVSKPITPADPTPPQKEGIE